MRVFRHWAQVTADLIIAGEKRGASFWGGSDLSLADAREQALAKVARVQQRINGGEQQVEPYEAEIREEILVRISDDAVITRNRYGAHVLNAARRMIFDVDDPPLRFFDCFRRKTDELRETRMRQAFERCRAQAQDPVLGFRLYRTRRGFRVIVSGADIKPGDSRAAAIGRALNTDPLYWLLCLRQNCYRARLTPKPSRLRHPGIRIRFGEDKPTAEEIRAWNDSYLRAAEKHSVCRWLVTIGSEGNDRLIDLHDDLTGARRDRPLA